MNKPNIVDRIHTQIDPYTHIIHIFDIIDNFSSNFNTNFLNFFFFLSVTCILRPWILLITSQRAITIIFILKKNNQIKNKSKPTQKKYHNLWGLVAG